MTRARILILGGTGEGFRLAEILATRANIDVVSSMAGRTPAPKVPVGRIRRGGFGGVDGLARYLETERIAAVVDATHPFASGISRIAASACQISGVPLAHIWRPGWTRTDEDQWTEVDTIEAASAAIPVNGGLTFLTTGKTQLYAFAGRHDVSFLARVVSPIPSHDKERGLPQRLSFVYDRGPFDVASERRLLQEYSVALIVSKNSGGNAVYAKLVAARELGVPVIMVRRPDAPKGRCVGNVEDVMTWLADLPTLDNLSGEGIPA